MNKFTNILTKLPISLKYLILFLIDNFIIIFSLWASFSLRLSYLYNPFNGSAKLRNYLPDYINIFEIYTKLFDVIFLFLLAPLIFIPLSIYFGL